MVNPCIQLIITDAALKADPVPVLLIKVPCRSYLVVLFAQFNGQLRIALQADSPAILRQVKQCKHLPGHFKDQGSVIEREAFGDSRF